MIIKELEIIDKKKFVAESEKIFKHQPFLLSLILGSTGFLGRRTGGSDKANFRDMGAF